MPSVTAARFYAYQLSPSNLSRSMIARTKVLIASLERQSYCGGHDRVENVRFPPIADVSVTGAPPTSPTMIAAMAIQEAAFAFPT